MIRFARTGLILLVLVGCFATISAPADASLSSLRSRLVGQARRHGDAQHALTWASRLDAGRPCGFTDLGCASAVDIATGFQRLADLADALTTTGSPIHGDPALLSSAVAAMERLDVRFAASPRGGAADHWQYETGIPVPMSEAAVLLWDQLGATARARFGQTIVSHLVRPQSGANLAWVAKSRIFAGVLAGNESYVDAGRAELLSTYAATGGAGYHPDGTYQFHDRMHSGGYGLSHLTVTAEMVGFLDATKWEYPQSVVDTVADRVLDTYEPFAFAGVYSDATRGREMTVKSDRAAGEQYVRAVADLSSAFGAQDRAIARSIVKHHVRTSGFPASAFNARAQDIARDPTVGPHPDVDMFRVLPDGDRAVYRRPDFAAVVSMGSRRLAGWESLNGNNREGWNTSEGALLLSTKDNAEYTQDYWTTVDRYRIPGTTVSTARRQPAKNSPSHPLPADMNTEAWVGGAALDDLHGSVGMSLARGATAPVDVRFRKSYFFLDDEIVALGTNISSAIAGERVETVLMNRRLSAGDTLTTSDGSREIQTTNDAPPSSTPGSSWLHLSGNERTGYVMLAPTTVSTVRESRTGNAAVVDASRTGEPNVTRRFQTAWIDHGVRPSDAGYRYVVLPSVDVADVRAYAAHPDVEVVRADDTVHAVADRAAGFVAANFWRSSPVPVAGLRVDRPAAVITHEAGGRLDVAISDPTQLNGGSIELEIDRRAESFLGSNDDDRIDVIRLEPKIVVRVRVDPDLSQPHSPTALRGKTYTMSFDLPGGGGPLPPLPVPTDLRAQDIAADRFTVIWQVPAGTTGVDGFVLEIDGRAAHSGTLTGTSAVVRSLAGGAAVTPATTYAATVRAVGGGRLGPRSATLMVTTSSPDDPDPGGTSVAYIAGSLPVPTKDRPLVALLRAQGYEVTEYDDSTVAAATAETHDLVVISTSVDPTAVGTRLTQLPTPILTWEPILYDELLLVAPGTTGRDLATDTTITITNPDHPLAAGQRGTTTVQTAPGITVATPVAGATVIATRNAKDPRATVFALPPGTLRTDGTPSPDTRIALFPTWNSTSTLTPAGHALLTAAARWALAGQ